MKVLSNPHQESVVETLAADYEWIICLQWLSLKESSLRFTKATVKSGPPIQNFRLRIENGFTIVELLMVMAILILLSALTIGSFKGIQAYQITSSATEFASVAKLAKQMAITSGKAVDLRLYKASTSATNYSGYRILQPADLAGNGSRPLSRIRHLPEGIVMRASSLGSTLLSDARETTETAPAGFIGDHVKVIGFRPNGSLNLPASPGQSRKEWTVTFAAENAAVVDNGLPANFATVSFDALLGTTEVYRP